MESWTFAYLTVFSINMGIALTSIIRVSTILLMVQEFSCHRFALINHQAAKKRLSSSSLASSPIASKSSFWASGQPPAWRHCYCVAASGRLLLGSSLQGTCALHPLSARCGCDRRRRRRRRETSSSWHTTIASCLVEPEDQCRPERILPLVLDLSAIVSQRWLCIWRFYHWWMSSTRRWCCMRGRAPSQTRDSTDHRRPRWRWWLPAGSGSPPPPSASREPPPSPRRAAGRATPLARRYRCPWHHRVSPRCRPSLAGDCLGSSVWRPQWQRRWRRTPRRSASTGEAGSSPPSPRPYGTPLAAGRRSALSLVTTYEDGGWWGGRRWIYAPLYWVATATHAREPDCPSTAVFSCPKSFG